jgi:hypothetical protein
VTALLLALFGGAACIATGSLMITLRNYAAAALDIGRQLDRCTKRSGPQLGKHPTYSRRHKARMAWRAAARSGLKGRDLRRDRMISALHGSGVRKIDRRRHFGHSIVLLPGMLVLE